MPFESEDLWLCATCGNCVQRCPRGVEIIDVMRAISISLNRIITEQVRPPRALFLGFSLGHPMGNPFDEKLQREILMDGLKYLKQIENPGTMVDLTGIYRTNPLFPGL